MEPKESLTMVEMSEKPPVMASSEMSLRRRADFVEDVEGVLGLVAGFVEAHVADGHELAHEALVFDDADVAFDAELAREAFAE